MMERVFVTGIDGNSIICSDGSVRSAIGLGRVVVGDVLWGNGGFVMSPGQPPASRPPIIWKTKKTGYHFASSYPLQMTYFDEDFNVVSTKSITPPDASGDFYLLIHCYNQSVEYFVWTWWQDGGYWRYQIQKGNEVIADFTSVFTDWPVFDAYINSDNDLVWAGICFRDGVAVGAKYVNGALTSTFTATVSDLTGYAASICPAPSLIYKSGSFVYSMDIGRCHGNEYPYPLH